MGVRGLMAEFVTLIKLNPSHPIGGESYDWLANSPPAPSRNHFIDILG